ncbi:TetR/AcrR family transcriptional regulator [Ruminococcus sp.]|uniref:TetR/AcrR family transcriptional regulator n=1 Tax=Ruminococcus sp. TaxID=41978 RepID=UPI0025DD8715|nr:TetR/AcrR family transcriptional regulator [Ruminococcus sp.]MBQ8966737.1 TetR/AcrR family transcriptional regulator [Ruminococcus sp.]
MNDSFFELPEEKRLRIINAGLRVFARYGYKKSPMNEIAAEAGISKSLLFYYFRNKKELYLYLANYSVKLNREEMLRQGSYEHRGFFDSLAAGLKVKVELLRTYPELAMFELNGYFEKDPELKDEINALVGSYSSYEVQTSLINIDPEEFIEGLDLKMMYRIVYLAAEGYLWELISRGNVDPDELEAGYMQLIDHWKKIYLRKGAKP